MIVKYSKKYERDIGGRRYHRLVAVRLVGRSKKGNLWECLCDCGGIKVTTAGLLNANAIRSCGCRKSLGTATHLMTETRIYRIWRSMRTRCNNPNTNNYDDYGGRGIKVCPEWSDFNCFYNDMKDGYEDHLQLDRVDNDADYCKENCKWSTRAEQTRNKRNNYWFEAGGLRMIKMDWAERWEVSHTTLNNRMKQGLTFQQLYDDYENR